MSRAPKVTGEVASQILDAGGLLPTGAKVPAGERVDAVVARAYRHPVLGDRTVVRLTAEQVAAGDDLEMEVLGFGAAAPRGAVGQERQRPLGFPGWALVHDPKHARYALAVVREFKKEARRARAKPGHARDGIEKIAERLGKSVPQFLPSFFEEAGRTFIEHGALSFAASMFGKAREAESVHALDTDEAHRARAFLEFALAGAVTTKALAQYAKDLAASHEPATAYALFRELCIKRTLGGMPPWGGMAKELRKLAKAAGKDPDAEDAALVGEVIESPALVNAAAEFWRAYAAPIQTLAASSPTIRGQLLNLWPTPTPGGAEADVEWLALLEGAGATRALYADGEPAAAQPAGGRAAWFDKLVAHTTRSWRERVPPPAVFGILRKMAPALVADGVAISCTRRWRMVDVDLAELALELGVPVAAAESARIDLEEWAKEAALPERGRDPVRVAAHPGLGRLIIASVADEIGGEPFDSVARGKQGLAAAKRAWLEGVLAAAEAGGLPAIETALETIDKRVTAATFAELPDLHARLAKLTVAPALARTLRGGVIDELGWPALEAAVAELDPDGKGGVKLTGAAPTIVVTNGVRAIAVAPTGRVGAYDLRLPAKAELHACRWVSGQLLALFRHDSESCATWSNAPDDVIRLDGYFYQVPTVGTRAVVLADGALCEGGAALRAGDRTVSFERTAVVSDGTTLWRAEWKDGEHKLREVSPTTGDLGRFSWPAFLEAFVADGWKLNVGASYVLPAPDIRSPLGAADGMIGVRARQPADAASGRPAWQLENVAGQRWDGLAGGGYPVELLTLPGDDRVRPVLVETAWRSLGTSWICDPTGSYRTCRVDANAPGYARGQATTLPVGLWPYLAPRDPAGSVALRAATEDAGRALIAAVDTAGRGSDALPIDLAAPASVVTAAIPGVTDPRLVRGLAGLAGLARRFEVVKAELVASRDPANAGRVAVAPLDDQALREALGGGYRWGGTSGSIAAQLAAVADAFFAGDTADRIVDELPDTNQEWAAWASAPGALVFLAQAFGIPDDERRAIARLLELLVGTGFVAASGRLRTWRGDGELGLRGEDVRRAVIWRGGNAYFVRRASYRGDDFEVLEYAPTGTFRPLAGARLSAQARGTELAPAAVAAFLARLAGGAPGWSAEAATAIAAATGLTSAEACLAWAGFPHLADGSARFLAKEAREAMGLKQQQAGAARDALGTVATEARIAVLAHAAADPAGLWDPVTSGAAARLADAWVRLRGKRTPVPDDLLVAADRDLWAPLQPGVALAMLANPTGAPALTTDGAFGFDHQGKLVRTAPGVLVVAAGPEADTAPAADFASLTTAAIYLPYLFAALPVGHPLAAQLPVAYELVTRRLDNPDLWLVQASNSHYGEDAETAIAAALASFGGDELPPPLVGRVGPAGAMVRADHSITLYLRPAGLHTATELARMRLHTVHYQRWDVSTRDVIAYLRSDELARMMKRVTDTPVPAGGWEQNPLASTPALVGRAAKALGTSREAAALYLQMLVLLWPTPKNVQTWNGWTPATYRAAIGELVDHELVLEAKRERAQRAHFLPGGWEAQKSPHPPMETWKVPLYSDERTATGDPKPRFQRFFAFDAPHVLFELAWERVSAGDPPRYEEVDKR